MTHDEWYCSDGERVLGPFPRQELHAKLPGMQGGDTLVCPAGSEEWRRSADTPELAGAAPERLEGSPAAEHEAAPDAGAAPPGFLGCVTHYAAGR